MSADDAPPLVEVHDLHKEYLLPRDSLLAPPRRVHALRGVSFDLRAGCNLGVVGESGCGKSTLARAVMGLEAPTHGHVRVLGTDVTTVDNPRRRHLRRNFQMVFQDPFSSLDPRRKVAGIVAEPLALERLGREESRERVVEVLEAVGLKASDTDKYPHEFSGGQRQRIAIARALVTRPALIVADEPVSALDVSVQAQVLNLLEDLRAQFGVTYMLISHDLAVVQYVCAGGDGHERGHGGRIRPDGTTFSPRRVTTTPACCSTPCCRCRRPDSDGARGRQRAGRGVDRFRAPHRMHRDSAPGRHGRRYCRARRSAGHPRGGDSRSRDSERGVSCRGVVRVEHVRPACGGRRGRLVRGAGHRARSSGGPVFRSWGRRWCSTSTRRDMRRIDREAGWAACEAASTGEPTNGSVGAGTGCTVGKEAGLEWASKGGQGSAVCRCGEVTVGALVAVNALGSVLGEDGRVIAGCRAPADRPRYPHAPMSILRAASKGGAGDDASGVSNTVIGCVVTNARLRKPGVCRVADLGHTGIARAVSPAHTSLDGDALFALATGEVETSVDLVAELAAQGVAEAVREGVRHAQGMPGFPADPRARRPFRATAD